MRQFSIFRANLIFLRLEFRSICSTSAETDLFVPAGGVLVKMHSDCVFSWLLEEANPDHSLRGEHFPRVSTRRRVVVEQPAVLGLRVLVRVVCVLLGLLCRGKQTHNSRVVRHSAKRN